MIYIHIIQAVIHYRYDFRAVEQCNFLYRTQRSTGTPTLTQTKTHKHTHTHARIINSPEQFVYQLYLQFVNTNLFMLKGNKHFVVPTYKIPTTVRHSVINIILYLYKSII